MLLQAESDWLSLARSNPDFEGSDSVEVSSSPSTTRPSVHVFRLAGLYGPGRSALDTVCRLGTAEEQFEYADPHNRVGGKFVSRIHVADVARILISAIGSDLPKSQARIYNVGDDCPAPRDEVLAYARKVH